MTSDGSGPPKTVKPQKFRWRVVALAMLLSTIGLAGALACDLRVIEWMREIGFAALKLRFERQQWWQASYVYGTLWLWACVTLPLLVAIRAKDLKAPRGRVILLALLPLIAAALSGGLADLLKPFLCRTRPEHAVAPAVYQFVDFFKNFPSGRGLGLPSSHAATAFGGATAVFMLFPRWGWVMFVPAVATCVSRVVAGAHYPSDVFVGAWLGYACGVGISTEVKKLAMAQRPALSEPPHQDASSSQSLPRDGAPETT